MKYKVIKNFGSAKKGDVLEEDEMGLLSFQIEDNETYRSMALDPDTASFLSKEGVLLEIEEYDTSYKVDNTIKLIDDLLEKYDKDLKDTLEKAKNGDIQPCVRLEAETVYFNLTKVLNKIKNTLLDTEEVKESHHE